MRARGVAVGSQGVREPAGAMNRAERRLVRPLVAQPAEEALGGRVSRLGLPGWMLSHATPRASDQPRTAFEVDSVPRSETTAAGGPWRAPAPPSSRATPARSAPTTRHARRSLASWRSTGWAAAPRRAAGVAASGPAGPSRPPLGEAVRRTASPPSGAAQHGVGGRAMASGGRALEPGVRLPGRLRPSGAGRLEPARPRHPRSRRGRGRPAPPAELGRRHARLALPGDADHPLHGEPRSLHARPSHRARTPASARGAPGGHVERHPERDVAPEQAAGRCRGRRSGAR